MCSRTASAIPVSYTHLQVISEEASATVRKILEQVVGDQKEGTGHNAYVAGYRIGGKTGTSTKTTEEIAGNKEYIVSFIGFAPADDPEIAILVLLDDPSSESGIYISGGQMAAPVVGKMMADILPYLGYEPEYTDAELENIDPVSYTHLDVYKRQPLTIIASS